MNNPKKNKRVPNSNSSLLVFKQKAEETNKLSPIYIYSQEESESTALDAVYDYLFMKLEDVNRGRLLERKL